MRRWTRMARSSLGHQGQFEGDQITEQGEMVAAKYSRPVCVSKPRHFGGNHSDLVLTPTTEMT